MNIYISNLPTTVTTQEVRELFRPYGKVKTVRLLEDKKTGILNGTAYVFMSSKAESEKAIRDLHGQDYKGHTLHVSEADAAEFPTSDFW